MLNAPKLSRVNRNTTKPFILTGGLNEELSSFELKGGELSDVQNYVEKDGSVKGYASFQGYERYDGNTSPTSIATVPYTGDLIQFGSTYDNAVWTDPLVAWSVTPDAIQDPEGTPLNADRITIDASPAIVRQVVPANQTSNNTLSFWFRIFAGTLTSLIVTHGSGTSSNVTSQVEGFGWSLISVPALDIGAGEDFDIQITSSVGAFTSLWGTSLTNSAFSVGETIDDVTREAARTAILPIPGSGITRGCHIYEGDVYGWRDDAGAVQLEMYKATAGGWSKITAATATAGGYISMEQVVNSRFSLYNTNNTIMVWVDSVNDIHIYNGTTVSTVGATGSGATVEDANLPVGVYPTHVGVWNNRLFLAYPKGNVFFSAVGDPTDFAAASGAGTFQVGDDITGFTVTPGGDLLLTMKDRIEFLTETTPTSSSTTFTFTKQTFSPNSGAIGGTVKRMLGTIYFADDRGVTTLRAAQEYGDFIANSLAKRVENTFQDIKGEIILATTNRQDNQYTLLYTDGANTYSEGLVFSFKGKRSSGATKIKLNDLVYNITEGKGNDRTDQVYFGSTGGYVFKLYTGTSFDGGVIDTTLSTSFYNYSSPTLWKHFKEVMIEITGGLYTSVVGSVNFDYGESYFPTESTASGKLDLSQAVTRLKYKVLGYGTNMRLVFATASKYSDVHNLHNMTTQYKAGATKV